MVHVSRSMSNCTAQKPDGEFCDRKSLPDAPFPVCLRHATLLLRYLNKCAPDAVDDRIILAARLMEQDHGREAERDKLRPKQGVVYYLLIGDLVKIGYTENLPRRMSAYPPGSELLATEPGSPELEVERHKQFSQYRKHRVEWYEAAPELLAHIQRVKNAQEAA